MVAHLVCKMVVELAVQSVVYLVVPRVALLDVLKVDQWVGPTADELVAMKGVWWVGHLVGAMDLKLVDQSA